MLPNNRILAARDIGYLFVIDTGSNKIVGKSADMEYMQITQIQAFKNSSNFGLCTDKGLYMI